MIEIRHNAGLKQFNTFHIQVNAGILVLCDDLDELVRWMHPAALVRPVLLLGQGSNILFTGDYRGTVIRYTNDEIRLLSESSDQVLISVGAGVIWDRLVEHCVRQGWHGIENLSLIPGSVGAAPVQNIGAYGAEISEVIEEVRGLDLEDFRHRCFGKDDCGFGYRTSIFKKELNNRLLISGVTLRLWKEKELNTGYGPVLEELERIGEHSVQNLRKAIIGIRSKKLPDHEVLGNAGSFFKNPVVKKDDADKLIRLYPSMPAYPAGKGYTKLAAGWLIEQCGWKGSRTGDAGVHANQALVLVNYGKASGSDILSLAMKIRESVGKKFGISLEPEVIIL